MKPAAVWSPFLGEYGSHRIMRFEEYFLMRQENVVQPELNPVETSA